MASAKIVRHDFAVVAGLDRFDLATPGPCWLPGQDRPGVDLVLNPC